MHPFLDHNNHVFDKTGFARAQSTGQEWTALQTVQQKGKMEGWGTGKTGQEWTALQTVL